MKQVQRVVTVIIFLFLYIPILLLAVASFNSGSDPAAFKSFTFHNYSALFHDHFLLPLLGNSLIVAVISVTQVLFLDEVGGLILASRLPVNLPELFVIFLERTIISLLIVCPVSHLLF